MIRNVFLNHRGCTSFEVFYSGNVEERRKEKKKKEQKRKWMDAKRMRGEMGLWVYRSVGTEESRTSYQ